MFALLNSSGCDITVCLNADMNGLFAHTPEPIPENLGDLCAAVVSTRSDLGEQ